MARDFDDVDLGAKLHAPKSRLRSSDPPDAWEFLGKSPLSSAQQAILSLKVWIVCPDGQQITDTIDVTLPHSGDSFDALSNEPDVAKADADWWRMWKEINDEVDRRIRDTQARLRQRCPRPIEADFKCVLKWRDLDMRAYPGGESATYYNVEFTLTSLTTGEVLGTGTAWVRIPGGHTHYGCQGSKILEAPSGLSGDDLLSFAKNASGFAFTSPPNV